MVQNGDSNLSLSCAVLILLSLLFRKIRSKGGFFGGLKVISIRLCRGEI